MTDSSLDGACCGNSRVGKIDFAFDMAHSSPEVAIRRGQRPFPRCEDTHIASEAGTAGGCADRRTCRKKYFEEAFFQSLPINLLSRRDDDEPQGGSDLFPFQNPSCDS